MTPEPLSIEELRELINEGKARDPLIFLEAVMNGQDPRKLSDVYDLVMDIEGFNEGDDIPRSDWNDLLDLVISRFKYSVVSLNESSSAARTLAEYLHPKRKHIEMSADITTQADANSDPLSEEEIELFKEKFNDEF